MKRILFAIALLLLSATHSSAEDLSVYLRFEANSAVAAENIAANVKSLKPVKIHPFTDRRSVDDTYLGSISLNGESHKVHSKTALSVYATDAFRKIYDELGGKISPDGPLALKGEITQFDFEESDSYQAKIGIHFFLLDASDRILWDGHSSGLVKGKGKVIGAENISNLFSDILHATFNEMLQDEKLVGVWSGRVPNTYVIRDDVSATVSAKTVR
jgi:hypothetical protein